MRPRPAPHHLIACLVALAAGFTAPLAAATDPLQPAGSGGLPAVERALDHLAHHRRLMVIGAHPDDEDDTLLAVASIGQGTDVAYLSLTRGEGGQNVIGGELGESLGVLRTEELLAGRRVDGARQLFTRAYDFGYTESLDETFSRWPREQLLVDVVRAIRRFRPQVVVAVFPPDERAGHGQHAASGALADDALRLAGDTLAFPQLDGEGLAPWQPELYFREAWRDPAAATLVLPSQGLDPLTGHTLFQIAMEVRSQHRSQSMGQLQDLEGRPVRLSHVTAPPEGESGAGTPAAPGGDGLFAGVDTRLTSLARLLPAGPEQERVYARLESVERTVAATRLALAPDRLAAAVLPLAGVLSDLRAAASLVARSPAAATPDGRHLAALLAEKEAVATEALAAAAGIVLDATTAEPSVVPGGSLAVTVRLSNGGALPLRVTSALLESPDGWIPPEPMDLHAAPETATSGAPPAATASAPPPAEPAPGLPPPAPGAPMPSAGPPTSTVVPIEPVEPGPAEPAAPEPAPVTVAPGGLLTLPGRVTVDAAALPTVPYYLARPRQGDLYDWEGVPPELRGEPFEPPPLRLRAELEVPAASGEGSGAGLGEPAPPVLDDLPATGGLDDADPPHARARGGGPVARHRARRGAAPAASGAGGRGLGRPGDAPLAARRHRPTHARGHPGGKRRPAQRADQRRHAGRLAAGAARPLPARRRRAPGLRRAGGAAAGARGRPQRARGGRHHRRRGALLRVVPAHRLRPRPAPSGSGPLAGGDLRLPPHTAQPRQGGLRARRRGRGARGARRRRRAARGSPSPPSSLTRDLARLRRARHRLARLRRRP